MGHVAVYDKSLKSCVTLVGVIYGPVGLDDPDMQFGRVLDTAGLYLPDCTPILQWVGNKIII